MYICICIYIYIYIHIYIYVYIYQENLDHRNLCHQATKKIKSYCNARYPTKDQVKKLQKRNGSMD